MSAYLLRPSSAAIWGSPDGCPGWLMMAMQYPENEESEAAREGTAAHEVAEIMVRAQTVAQKPNIPEIASNGVAVTEQMIEGAEIYADDVGAVMRKTGIFGGDYLGIESPLAMPTISEHNGGTPDLWLYDSVNNTVYVWDYKFGHRYVDAFENWQMIDYAAGVLDLFGVDGILDQMTTIVMRIVQPRVYGRPVIREWRVRADELRPYFNQLHAGGARTLKGGDVKSGKHCRDCSACHACPAAQRAAGSYLEHVEAAVPVELDPVALGVELAILSRAQKAVEYRLEALKTQAETVARSGTVVPGWELSDAKGRTRWAKGHDEVVALGEMYQIDLIKPALITPKQAEKAGIAPEVIALYSETPTTGVKLTESNPRRVFK